MLASFAKKSHGTKKAGNKTAPAMVYITGEAAMLLVSWLVEQFTDQTEERGTRIVYSDDKGSVKVWQNNTKNGMFFGASDPAGDDGKKQFLWFYANVAELTEKPAFGQVRPEVFAPWGDLFEEDFGMSFAKFCAENAKPKEAKKPAEPKVSEKPTSANKTRTATANKTRRVTKAKAEETATAEEPTAPTKQRARRTTASKSKGAKLA